MQAEHALGLMYRRRYGLVLSSALVLYLLLSVAFFLGAGCDDQFITLWQGESLAAGNGFINYNGERVEVSSSLLHTLIVAVIAIIDSEHVFIWNKFLGLISGAGVLVLLHLFRGPLLPGLERTRFPAYAAAMAFTASCPCFLYWNLGGLEGAYVALILTAYGALLESHWRAPALGREAVLGCIAGLFVLTRPEGFYLALFAMLHAALFWTLRGRRLCLIVHPSIALAAFLSITLWRLTYFGAAFPNPVYAKSGLFAEHVINGAHYAQQFALSSALTTLCCAVVLASGIRSIVLLLLSAGRGARPKPERLDGMLVAGLIATVFMAVILAGGDWMMHFRFLAPITPLLIVFGVAHSARTIEWLLRQRPHQMAPLCLGVAILVLVVGLLHANYYRCDTEDPQGGAQKAGSAPVSYRLQALFRDWDGLQYRLMRTCPSICRDLDALEPAFDDLLPSIYAKTSRIAVATRQMGYFPYTLKKRFPDWNVRLVDLSGLTDPFVARGLTYRTSKAEYREVLRIDRVLRGEAPILSEYVRKQRPNMVYTLGFNVDMNGLTTELECMGFERILGRTGAHLFYRPNSDNAR